MLVLLPPSESKRAGSRGAPLDLEALSFPALTATRERLVTSLQAIARTQPAALSQALGLTERQSAEVRRNAVLTGAPTLTTGALYSGVLYDALSYATLDPAGRRRANRSLVVASALFGLLRPTDRIPPYRLSAVSSLPGLPSLPALWRPVLEPELAGHHGLVVDLRSASYAALARVPGAASVRVLRESAGRRTVVSHDNKHTKGRLARALCEHGARTVADLADVARSVSDDVEVAGSRVDVILHGLASARPQTVSG